MTPQELKASILQLAIQGKLVEQRPEEGTGAELLERILATKNTKGTKKNSRAETPRRRGKADAASPREEIPDSEKPFDIPESWVWVRLGEVVFNHGQKKPTGDFSYIDIGSIDNKNQRLSNDETIVHAENASPRARKIVQKGDVIYATVRPYLHNVCVIDREFSREPIASTGFAVMACADCLDNKYLFYFLLSPDFDRYANSSENAKGVAYPAISDKRLYDALIPLPPLAEQKRIVAKIEELLPYIDRYEKAWSKLEDFNKRFPGDMQKSLLQMAIQGKLVDQRAEEGTAAELLEKILAAKNARGAKKNLTRSRGARGEKKTSALSASPREEIPDDEKPFDIPERWEWVRLGEVIDYRMGKTPPRADLQWWSPDIPWVSIADMPENGHVLTTKERVSRSAIENLFGGRVSEAGTLLMSFKLTVGRVSILDIDAVHNEAIISIFPCHDEQGIFKSYLFLILPFVTQFGDSKSAIKGKTLNSKSISNLPIPLPPLAEQKRIVAKLEELLPLCERLK